MDIDAKKFRQSLVHILKDISEAKIVTFDLEMSGIRTKTETTGDRSSDTGKPTLQQLYEDMKSAAKTYQVLQLGITCVSEDPDKEHYLTKAYNFTLSPLTLDTCKSGSTGLRLKLNRNFTFSGSATEFLATHSFDFGKVFTDGVHYLSRDEEIELTEDYDERQNKIAKIADDATPDIMPRDYQASRIKRDYKLLVTGNRQAHELISNQLSTLESDVKTAAWRAYLGPFVNAHAGYAKEPPPLYSEKP